MARLAYTYEYKEYPDCPEATKLSKFWCSPKHGAWIGFPLGCVLIALAVLIYNGNGHQMGALDGLLVLLGFAFFLFGAFLIPWLFRLFRISDRVYEKKTGNKLS